MKGSGNVEHLEHTDRTVPVHVHVLDSWGGHDDLIYHLLRFPFAFMRWSGAEIFQIF